MLIILIILHDNNGRKLSDLLADYKQMITEPTHITGSLIDHVYVKQITVLDQFVCHSTIKNIYFSDHVAIKIRLKIKRIPKLHQLMNHVKYLLQQNSLFKHIWNMITGNGERGGVVGCVSIVFYC